MHVVPTWHHLGQNYFKNPPAAVYNWEYPSFQIHCLYFETKINFWDLLFPCNHDHVKMKLLIAKKFAAVVKGISLFILRRCG